MAFDPISYSAINKLKKGIGQITENDTIKVNTISPKDYDKITVNGNILPDTDNTRSIGSATNRLANLYVVNLYTGDVRLMNNWIVTERDENGNLIDGVRILCDNGCEIFRITKDGIYFKGKKLKLMFEE